MEIGVPSDHTVKLHNLLYQKSVVEKNLEVAMEEARDPEADSEVKRWQHQLTVVQKGLQRVMYGSVG